MKECRLIALMLLMTLLCACTVVQPPATVPSTEATLPSTVLPTEPPTSAPTPEPTPAPTEPELEEADRVVFNGSELTLWSWQDAQYVSAAELAQAMHAVPVQDNEIWTLSIGAGELSVSCDGMEIRYNDTPTEPDHPAVSTGGVLYLPLKALTNALAISEYVDPDTQQRYLTPGAARFSVPAGHDVPVLMYHAVSDDLWGIAELFVSPASLEQQLVYLLENGYQPIWFEDLRDLDRYEKPVLLTFDDGYTDNYTELFPLLKKYNVKATIFVIAGHVGLRTKMDADQIRELSASGLVSIQSHAYSHEYLSGMGRKTLEYELGESKKLITRMTGREPSVLCYPTGMFSDLSLEVTEQYYNFGLKMNGGMYHTDDSPYLISRFYVSRWTGLERFASYLTDTCADYR